MLALPGGRFAAQDAGQFLEVGQRQRYAQGQRFEFLRQLHLRADQHDGVRGRALPLHDLAQLAQAHRVAQQAVEVEHQVDAAFVLRADRVQRGGGIRRHVAVGLGEIEPAQAVGQGPAPQRTQGLRNHMAEAIDHPLLVHRLDHQQRRGRAHQRGEVFQFAHETPL